MVQDAADRAVQQPAVRHVAVPARELLRGAEQGSFLRHPREWGPGGLTREVETPLPSTHPKCPRPLSLATSPRLTDDTVPPPVDAGAGRRGWAALPAAGGERDAAVRAPPGGAKTPRAGATAPLRGRGVHWCAHWDANTLLAVGF